MVSCNSSNDKSLESNELEKMDIPDEFDNFGIYRGILPCADCPGIRTELQLKEPNEYQLRTQLIDRSDSIVMQNGKFEITDSIITLSKNGQQYSLTENGLAQLYKSGDKISDSLANNYLLIKDFFPLKNTKWELVELMGAAVSPNEETNVPYIMLNASENTSQGFAGCNGLGGNYQLNAETLRLSLANL